MDNKFEDLLQFLGVISSGLVLILFVQLLSLKSDISNIEKAYYNARETVLDMISENETVLLELKANETHDFYDYDYFTDAFRTCDEIIEEFAK